jgi:hypothetical protein
LYFAAVKSETGNISVKAYANGGNLVWSQTCDGNNIFGAIPAEITEQYEFDYISFDNTSGQSLAKKISDPIYPDSGNAQALVILPNPKLRLMDFRSIAKVQTAFKNRGIKYKKLADESATYDSVAWQAWFENIKYVYLDGDGNYRLVEGGTLRTVVWLYDGPVVSMKQTDFLDPCNAPSWCVRLEGNLENTTRSFLGMGFDSLEFAQFDTCYGGHLKIDAHNDLIKGQPGQIGLFDGPHSDMSIALGMGETSRTRIYQAWYDLYTSQKWPSETDYQKWTQDEWEYLGDGESLYWSIMHAIDGQTEFDDPNAPVNTYRFKGQGFLTELVLNND